MKIFCLVLLLFTCSLKNSFSETTTTWQPMATGMALFFAPMTLQGGQMTPMLGWEHEGLTFMASVLGGWTAKAVDKNLWWVGPVATFTVCTIYHIGEIHDEASNRFSKEKILMDGLGCLAGSEILNLKLEF